MEINNKFHIWQKVTNSLPQAEHPCKYNISQIQITVHFGDKICLSYYLDGLGWVAEPNLLTLQKWKKERIKYLEDCLLRAEKIKVE